MDSCTSLPAFPPFDPEPDRADVASRWKKWLAHLENLCVAFNVTDDLRKRALLLHYTGEKVYIFDAEKPPPAPRPNASASGSPNQPHLPRALLHQIQPHTRELFTFSHPTFPRKGSLRWNDTFFAHAHRPLVSHSRPM